MSDDMLIHFSSNSSNQSDQSLPSKIAKLEARMVGKASPAAAVSSVSVPARFGPSTAATATATAVENVEESSLSSDSDDNDNGDEYLIRANTKKRQRVEDDHSDVFENVENAAESRPKILVTMDSKTVPEGNRKTQIRGRDHTTSSRGRGARVNDRAKARISPPAVLQSNGQLENSCFKAAEEPKEAVFEREAPIVEREAPVVVEKESAIGDKEAERADECKSLETDNAKPKSNSVDNAVLRKLLRGPRYFDPPGSSWGTCYNCGSEGHAAVNCTSAKRTKPCFVCGSLEHNVKQCLKGKDCYICKKGGHRAKDCLEKKLVGGPHSFKLCLKCGEAGHEMFTCRNDYSADDLKEIQCYICKSFGHLCCVSYSGTAVGEVSCYRCGQTGHTGLACTRLRNESNGTGTPSSCYRCGEGGHFARECTSSQASTWMRGESNVMGTPSSCYKCGEGGHFARDCTSSVKSSKRNREYITPKSEGWEQDDNWAKSKALPFDLDIAQDDRGFSASPRAKRKNGWHNENSGEYPRIKEKQYKNSPLRPTNKIKFPDSTVGGGYASTPYSYGSARHHRFDNSHADDTQIYQNMYSVSDYSHRKDYAASRSTRFYQHVHSASKSRNSRTGKMKNYYN